MVDILVWIAVVFSIILIIFFAVASIASAIIFNGALRQVDDPFEVDITSERKK